jgi:hypothetical protein
MPAGNSPETRSDREILDRIDARVAEMHAVLEQFRPLLDLVRPNGHPPDWLDLAQARRTLKRAKRT